ncbi:hypothetical protein [Dyadobacter sp. CY323]|uniref:hypothetical protein n=1 Tax=Dyadobacter sp. CY323 TaxID=2907302 RepID=UPI001F27FF44|nr:hypothetical protein [Dyadobacter sp. CY323]MCE6993180.1 hypothetical protein [Dyadobacter sp. CY323]
MKKLITPLFILTLISCLNAHAQTKSTASAITGENRNIDPKSKSVSDRLENRYTPGNEKESFNNTNVGNNSANESKTAIEKKPSQGSYLDGYQNKTKGAYEKGYESIKNSAVGEQQYPADKKAISNSTEKPKDLPKP